MTVHPPCQTRRLSRLPPSLASLWPWPSRVCPWPSAFSLAFTHLLWLSLLPLGQLFARSAWTEAAGVRSPAPANVSDAGVASFGAAGGWSTGIAFAETFLRRRRRDTRVPPFRFADPRVIHIPPAAAVRRDQTRMRPEEHIRAIRVRAEEIRRQRILTGAEQRDHAFMPLIHIQRPLVSCGTSDAVVLKKTYEPSSDIE